MRTAVGSRRLWSTVPLLGWLIATHAIWPSLLDAQDVDGLTAALAVQRTFTRAIKQSEASVVSIARVRRSRVLTQAPPTNPFGLRFRNRNLETERQDPTSSEFIPEDFGSGIIITDPDHNDQRLILTNYHVVRGGPPDGQTRERSLYAIYVRFADKRGYEASILAADPRSDLAVLAIDFAKLGIRSSDLKPIRFAEAPTFQKGQFVLALGNPYAIARDGSASASWGIISNTSRRPAPVAGSRLDPESRRKETIHHFGTLLQVDTRLNLGSSGGALLNLRGELIGITTSLAALDGYETSAGYAVPLTSATKRIIKSLVRGHEVEYGFLGVQPRDVSPAELHRLSESIAQSSAAMCFQVFANSPASLGGLRPGDVVLSVNGRPVTGRYDLMRMIGELGPGATARLRVWRGRDRSLRVSLGKWPVYDEDGIIATRPRHRPWRGLLVDYSTARSKFVPFPYQYYQAVVALRVVPRSRADRAELKAGDFITHVNNTAVRTPDEFYHAVKMLRGNIRLTLVDGRHLTVHP